MIYSTVTFSYSFAETFRIATSPSFWEGEGHFPLTVSSGQPSWLVESELVACVGTKILFKGHDKGLDWEFFSLPLSFLVLSEPRATLESSAGLVVPSEGRAHGAPSEPYQRTAEASSLPGS